MDKRELEAFEVSVLADDEIQRMLEDVTRSVTVEVEQQSPRRVDVTMGLGWWGWQASGSWLKSASITYEA
jgi:hypothetical protein